MAVCCIVLLMLLGPGVVPPKVDNLHYVYLAHSMTEGKLTVDNIPTSYADVVTFQGHKYLPFGPLPAVVLIPFLPILDLGVHIVWVGYLLTLLNIWVLYMILGATGIKDERRPWALLLFFGGTVYLSVTLVGSSYFLAAVLTVTCILLAILEVGLTQQGRKGEKMVKLRHEPKNQQTRLLPVSVEQPDQLHPHAHGRPSA